MADEDAPEMYITGIAGTGKTTSLDVLVRHCIANDISYNVMAYTHKACGVLRTKLVGNANISTLHSFLVKRPTINMEATKVRHLEGNTQMGDPDRVKVVFIDEFSMVGERDYVDLKDMQFEAENGNLLTKIVFIGDPNQLPPVKDMIVIVPNGKYQVQLTQIHRQAEGNPLIQNLLQLNGMINGDPTQPLIEHERFTRGQDIVHLYSQARDSKILLAYTNARVEQLNAQVQGRTEPLIGDRLFSPTTREFYILEGAEPFSDSIVKINGDILELDSKYRTLETLHEIEAVRFFYMPTDEGHYTNRAVVFGHDEYKKQGEALAKAAVAANKLIETRSDGLSAKDWSFKNWKHPLAKKRKHAWKYYLAFKEAVICVDFAHAMTVHKSQGSTYDHVFLDTEDIYKCANNDWQLYLKLMYVGISRAAHDVYTN